ncbi:Plant seed peroxygenase [Bertholletia excelsa]
MASSSVDSPAPLISVHGEDQNVLKKHAGFFDQNKDGFIYPWETYQDKNMFPSDWKRDFGVPRAAIFVNVGLSRKTTDKFSLLFPIEIKNIQKGKHGSDTGAYDHQGRFVPSKFEEIFKKHSHTNPNALTSKELQEMLKANREPMDFNGWITAFVEWKILYDLAKDKTGLLQKDKIRGVYDGSLFEQLEKERNSKTKKRA